MKDLSVQDAARLHAASLSIGEIDPSREEYFRTDTIKHYLKRLRDEDPVHWAENESCGKFWSLTKYDDILNVNMDWKTFSSSFKYG